MVALLAAVPGTGEVLESGYVVYSPSAKKRLLGVSPQTIERYGLTSEAVAWEMALGALKDSDATVAIASTGVAGPQPQDGIAPGTVCFAWAFAGEPLAVFTRSQRFFWRARGCNPPGRAVRVVAPGPLPPTLAAR